MMLRAVGSTLTRHHCRRPCSSVVRRFASSSLFGSSSFWSDLRQRAAAVITSSLSDTERQAVLAKYNPNPQKSENDFVTKTATSAQQPPKEDDGEYVHKETLAKTISEAVAEARAQEAAKQMEKWTNEMQVYQQKMEDAARARVEKDLILERRKLQFEQWKKELEQTKTKESTEIDTTSSPDNTPQPLPETASKDADPALENHGLLGPVLQDLGSKRLHLVAADILADLPVWKRQRTFRLDRAKSMAKEKAKSLHLGIPGIICLVEDKDGNLSIIDGQHRVGMMKLLAENQANIDLSRILVEVYTDTKDNNSKDDFARDLFVEINKAEPVKLVDMPGVAKEADRRILTEAAEKIQEQYPDMFSASQRCRAPHLNIDNLRDALFSSGILKKHDLKSSKALVKWLLEKNQALADKYQQDQEAAKYMPPRALEKAQKFQFYLGLESGWMYE